MSQTLPEFAMNCVCAHGSARPIVSHTLVQSKLIPIGVLQPSKVLQNPSSLLPIEQGQLFLYCLNGHGGNLHLLPSPVKDPVNQFWFPIEKNRIPERCKNLNSLIIGPTLMTND